MLMVPDEAFRQALDYLHSFRYMTCVWDGAMVVAVRLDTLGHEIETNPSAFLLPEQIDRYKTGPLGRFAVEV